MAANWGRRRQKRWHSRSTCGCNPPIPGGDDWRWELGRRLMSSPLLYLGCPKIAFFYEEHGKMRLNKNHGVGGFSHDFRDKNPIPDMWQLILGGRK